MNESTYLEYLLQIDRLDALLDDSEPEQGLTQESLELAAKVVRLDEVTP